MSSNQSFGNAQSMNAMMQQQMAQQGYGQGTSREQYEYEQQRYRELQKLSAALGQNTQAQASTPVKTAPDETRSKTLLLIEEGN